MERFIEKNIKQNLKIKNLFLRNKIKIPHFFWQLYKLIKFCFVFFINPPKISLLCIHNIYKTLNYNSKIIF